MSQGIRSRGARATSPPPNDAYSEVLDSDEQAEIVQQLRQQSSTQAHRTRKVFAAICAFCAASMAYCLYEFLFGGAQLHHQTRFEPLLSAPVLVAYYIGSAAAYLLAAKICLEGRRFAGSWAGIAISAVTAVGWLIAFYQQGITHFTYYWLPFGPLGISLLALYVDQEMTSLVHDAEVLETLKYDFKKI